MPLKYFVIVLQIFICTASIAKSKVLVFFKTAGFKHQSIGAGIAAIQKLGDENKFKVDTTSDASAFTYKNLKKYDAVVFLNTTGDVLNDMQQKEFQKYINAGKGYVGIHAATDTEYGWPWYGQLTGAYFNTHPKVQQATLIKTASNNPFTSHLPEKWSKTDEWYNFKGISDKITVVLTVDEQSYTGGTNGANHPISWYQEFDGGRAFTTALGHTAETYSDDLFLKHLLAGMKYAMGKH
ncbi:ThuA domain-containing protein [Mucilaginibacter aquatilis]|uniref:ThuA domain-containing protein n=1 Tax=Mucilaginibacter aquatilis TaxID=1517760 RepID=A0A6I4I9Q1_9SPHI|nr:ThuA domain-containing protein [Mucilaginibacter aquatilis]MVN91930.1 ThuA domain-containing protein [Mucilaginibacter aquatilis]